MTTLDEHLKSGDLETFKTEEKYRRLLFSLVRYTQRQQWHQHQNVLKVGNSLKHSGGVEQNETEGLTWSKEKCVSILLNASNKSN